MSRIMQKDFTYKFIWDNGKATATMEGEEGVQALRRIKNTHAKVLIDRDLKSMVATVKIQ